VGHAIGEIGPLAFAEPIVVLVVELGRDGFFTVTAGGAALVDVTRGELDGRGITSRLALDVRHLRHGEHPQVGIHLGAALVDLQTAGGETQLGEVFIELGDASTQIRALLDQHDLLPGLGGLQRCSHAADATTDHQDGLVGCDDFRHGLSSVFAEWFWRTTRRVSRRQRAGLFGEAGRKPTAISGLAKISAYPSAAIARTGWKPCIFR